MKQKEREEDQEKAVGLFIRQECIKNIIINLNLTDLYEINNQVDDLVQNILSDGFYDACDSLKALASFSSQSRVR